MKAKGMDGGATQNIFQSWFHFIYSM